MIAARTRRLEARDVPAARGLVNAEGWAFTEAELARLLAFGTGVIAEVDGRAVGVLTLATHEHTAWIGNVAVEPAFRGRGVGAQLVDAALAEADARTLETVGLYSVLPAVSLYRRAGFRALGDVGSFRAIVRPRPFPSGIVPLAAANLADVERLDRRASGDGRRPMLRVLRQAFPRSSFALVGADGLRGFVVAKPSPTGGEIGPLAIEPGDEDALAALYDAALASLPSGVGVEAGVPLAHAAAVRLLEARGFEKSFPAVAMHRGAPGHEGNPMATGAVAGMEKG